ELTVTKANNVLDQWLIQRAALTYLPHVKDIERKGTKRAPSNILVTDCTGIPKFIPFVRFTFGNGEHKHRNWLRSMVLVCYLHRETVGEVYTSDVFVSQKHLMTSCYAEMVSYMCGSVRHPFRTPP
ncbi:hypothetical protein BGZ49_006046, partial [Haplosporangium sp. Z 27]